MKRNFIPIISIVFLISTCLNSLKSQTPTILGGAISYESIGLNTYSVSLNVYTDCLGGVLPDTVFLDWMGPCQGTNSGIVALPKNAASPVDVTGFIFLGASSCNGGSGSRGVAYYRYTDTLVVPGTCPSINLSWLSCCRNDSLTSIINPATTPFYLETTFDNLSMIGNSSVLFTFPPVIGACNGFPGVYNQGAFDPDGDSLRYALTSCLEGANDPVNYFAAFSGVAPFGAGNPITIDPQTGQINYTAPINQTSLFCVLVEEVRAGVVISSTIREIAVVGLSCPINNMPIITGIDSTNLYDTTIVLGQSICFEVHGEDLDINQELLMLWNNGIAGATFIIDTMNNPIGTFCWTPSPQDTGQHAFVVELRDNNGPVPGAAVEQFRIEVSTGLATNPQINTPIQNQFKIYPNPASKQLHIVFDQPLGEVFDLRIIDAQGKIVQEHKQQHKTSLEIDIHHLISGLYSVVIVNKKGAFLEQKLIVQ